MNRELYEAMRRFFDSPFAVHDNYLTICSIAFTYPSTSENEATAQKFADWYTVYRPRLGSRISHKKEESTLTIFRKK